MDSLPKRRIGKITSGLLLGTFVLIDLIQIILDAFAIGLVVNNFMDIGAALFLVAFLVFKGVPIVSDLRIFAAVSIAILGENIPLPLLEVAPFWSLDVLYIIRTVNKEDSQRIREAMEAQQAELERLEQQRIMRMQLNSENDYDIVA